MNFLRYLCAVVLSLGLGAVVGHADPERAAPQSWPNKIWLDVYKSPTCGCCTKWVDHAQANGFDTAVHHPKDLAQVKDEYAIASDHWACHTAVSEDGYVFEGHIPARYIREFFASPPKGAMGLAVPRMPVGSPGMETENKFSPYQVLLLKANGESEVFAEVKSAQEQYR
ncbi:MAG: DUF411 domain-containing protein [Gammaproteobacteria bacterium]|nr:DUF411 domain-containing protein [Gammaproteobacteria bacterium]